MRPFVQVHDTAFVTRITRHAHLTILSTRQLFSRSFSLVVFNRGTIEKAYILSCFRVVGVAIATGRVHSVVAFIYIYTESKV